MDISPYFSQEAPVFHGMNIPEEGYVVGYSAIISKLKLELPLPDIKALVCKKNKTYRVDDWNVFPQKYLPDDNGSVSEIEALYKHLVFALKYEGVNLLVFSFITKHYKEKQLAELVDIEPTGQYSRRIWFLIEWIIGKEIVGKKGISKKNYIQVLDAKLQYDIEGIKSKRHMVINNLPGTPNFCPLIRKTDIIEKYIGADFSEQNNKNLKGIHKDILQRTSSFLLLKDSKASFTIEGESPKSKRAARWGQIIGQAGSKDLSVNELIRLQQVVIENARFVEMGARKKGGFVGEHDRVTGEPLPDHISAKWQDVEKLLTGLEETNELLLSSNMDAVLSATMIAFGFVFIHPFVDGNGRIHRYLIHNVLAKKGFSKQGIIFPVSASILDHIDDYRNVLESYSHPLLDFIKWEGTKDHNVEVLNNTFDYYRFFDATNQAEFLYECVNDTIQNIIPDEIDYLTKYDEFKRFLDDEFEMPDKMVAQLVRFLEQNKGKLSRRARDKEFSSLNENELKTIEDTYKNIFEF